MKKLISLDEFAEICGIGRHTADKMAKDENFPKIKIGNSTRVISDKIDDFLKGSVGKKF